MSIQYCHSCGKHVDLDFNCEHFASDGETCFEKFCEDLKIELEMKNPKLNDDEIEDLLEKKLIELGEI